MELHFASRRLLRCYTHPMDGVRDWGPAVARAYVKRLLLLKSLDSFAEVRRFAQFRAHPLRGRRSGQWTLELHGRWRLIVMPLNDEDGVMIEEVSNHYGD